MVFPVTINVEGKAVVGGMVEIKDETIIDLVVEKTKVEKASIEALKPEGLFHLVMTLRERNLDLKNAISALIRKVVSEGIEKLREEKPVGPLN